MKVTLMMFYETGADVEIVKMKFKNMVNVLNVAKEIEGPKCGTASWLPGMDAMSGTYEVK